MKWYAILIIMGVVVMSGLVNAEQVLDSSTTRSCDSGRCTTTLYSYAKYVFEDNEWKDYSEARSLKGKGWKFKYLENDADYGLNIIDFNSSSVTLSLNVSDTYSGVNVPFNVYDTNGDLKYQFLVNLNRFQNKEYTIPMELFNKFSFGFASTTIILDSEGAILEDAHSEQNNPTITDGDNNEMDLHNRSGTNKRIYTKFNLSSIPEASTILDARWHININVSGLDNGAEGYNISSRKVYDNYSWVEDTLTWNNQPALQTDIKPGFSDTFLFTGASSLGWYELNVTDYVQENIDDTFYNMTLALVPHALLGNPAVGDDIHVLSKEDSTTGHYLNVTHSGEAADDPPSITSLTESPSDPATYSQGQIYEFNATVTDDNSVSSVVLEFNGTNQSPTATGSVYNYTVADLPSGDYSYTWHATDNAGQTSSSASTYTINKASSGVSTYLNGENGDKSITNDTNANFTGYLDTGVGNIKFYVNGSLWNEGTSPLENISTLGIGNYTGNTSYEGNENYSFSSEAFNLTINTDYVAPAPAANATNVTTIEITDKLLSVPYSLFDLRVYDNQIPHSRFGRRLVFT